jgi:hypothetical protein
MTLVLKIYVIADAGPDRTIALPVNWVILEAATSPPPSPQSPPVTDVKSTTTWQWSSVSGPAPVHFSAVNQSRTNVTELTRGVYVLKLVVTDTADATSANDTVTITVLQSKLSSLSIIVIFTEIGHKLAIANIVTANNATILSKKKKGNVKNSIITTKLSAFLFVFTKYHAFNI